MIKKYTVDELVTDESFIAYCTHSDAEATVFWTNYLIDAPDQEPIIKEAKYFIYALREIGARAELSEAEKGFSQLVEQNYGQPRINVLDRKNWFARSGIRWIAASLLLIGGGAIWLSYSSNRSSDLDYEVGYGKTLSIVLSDGSKVKLNSNSKLHLHKGFNKSNRELDLNGEALFDVSGNALRPFIVHTEKADIKVLGTVFNVKAYTSDQLVETSLLSGRLQVQTKGPKAYSLILEPNKKASLDLRSNKVLTIPGRSSNNGSQIGKPIISSVTPIENGTELVETAWLNSKLAFAEAALADIAPELERRFAIKIHFEDNEIPQYKFTGTFKDESLPEILKAFKQSKNFSYRIEKKEIYLSAHQ